MRKLLFTLLLLTTTIINAQTSSAGYINIKYGSEHSIVHHFDHVFHNVGVQFGGFITDNWGFEVDYAYGMKNDLNSYRLGANAVYQFIDRHYNITPFTKLGVAYRSYEYNDKVMSEGCDIKLGAGINIPISDSWSMNLGVNISNYINDVHNSWDNTLLEFEVGICYLIY